MKQAASFAALTVAILGAALLWLYKQRFEAETSGGSKVEILAAASDLQLGSTLDAKGVTTRFIPEAYLENRHILAAQAQKVLGVRVRSRINAGEAILWTDLATSGANSRDLSGLVMPGMRAIAIPASEALIFDGLLRPGDRVDTLLTVTDEKTDRVATVPLLQNLIVLATGSQTGQVYGEEGEEKERISTVTLAVKPEQAQLLASAMAQGKLSIVLRNADDIRIVDAERGELEGTGNAN